MKKNLFTILLSAFALTGFSQTHIWSGSCGDTGGEMTARTSCTDITGTYVVAGSFTGNVDLDPAVGNSVMASSAGQHDIFIQVFNSSNTLMYSLVLGGPGDDLVNGLGMDQTGNVFLCGSFEDSIDVQPFFGENWMRSSGQKDAFLLKYNFALTSPLWVNVSGGAQDDEALGLTVGGFVCVSGSFEGSGDFSPGPATITLTSNGAKDAFIQMFNPFDNTLVWARSAGGPGSDYANTIRCNQSTEIYVAGSFEGTADLDFGPQLNNNISAGGSDMFLVKINLADGSTFNWVTVGGPGDDAVKAMTSDETAFNSCNVYLSGYFSNTVDFAPGSAVVNKTAAGMKDAFLMKLNPNFQLVWANAFGGSGDDMVNAMDKEFGGNYYYTTGTFDQGAIDLDPGAGVLNFSNMGSTDVFAQQFDPSGNLSWGNVIQSAGTDLGNAIRFDIAGGNVILAGGFTANVDVDPLPGFGNVILTPAGLMDEFICKWGPCSNTSSVINASVCDSYVLNNTTYTTSGTYQETIPNAAGCDSVITLNLQILSSTGMISATGCGSVLLNNQTYTTSGIYNQIFSGANQYGCDSTLVINVTIYTVDTGLTVSAGGDSLTIQEPGSNVFSVSWIDCNTNQILATTNPSFAPTATGDYSAIITTNSNAGGCTATTACVHVVISGIETNEVQQGISIYPNPVNDVLQIEIPSGEINAVEMYDITGALVKSFTNAGGNKIKINTTELAAGVYFIRVQSGNEMLVRKFSKE